MYIRKYKTPEGFDDLLMSSDGEYLTGLWFENSRYAQAYHASSDCDADKYDDAADKESLPVFRACEKWLDGYFSGHPADVVPEIKIRNLTPFRKEVLDIVRDIPYGQTVTYGDIARQIADKRSKSPEGSQSGARMSAQAVGQAVGWNPICLIFPCHRVVGVNGSLTGYGGGLENKARLLLHEQKKA